MKNSVFCVFCAKDHKLESDGKSYFCDKEQIDRNKKDQLIYWDGREFRNV